MIQEDEFHQIDPNRVLDSEYWVRFFLPENPTMREKILAVTIDDIGRVGATSFNAKFTCEALGVAPSLINHHFGGRDELIAEATLICYRNYVRIMWEAVLSAKQDPKLRLRSWVVTQVEWTARMAGWGPILNYPTSSLNITRIIDSKYRTEMTKWSELHLARLVVLVGDIKRGRVSDINFDIDNVPKAKILRDVNNAALAASIGWSTLGISVWRAGRHLPSGLIKEVNMLEKQIIKSHIDRIINQIAD